MIRKQFGVCEYTGETHTDFVGYLRDVRGVTYFK